MFDKLRQSYNEMKLESEAIKEYLPKFVLVCSRLISYMTYFSWVLAAVFIASKLIGTIHWSWAIVLCPIWIGFSLAIVLTVLLATAMFAASNGGD